MRKGFVPAAAISAAIVLYFATRPDEVEDQCEKWDLVTATSILRSEAKRESDLNRSQQCLLNQIKESDRVAVHLLEGRISLAEAVEELDRINHGRLAPLNPDTTRREILVEYIINKVASLLHNSPNEAEVLIRLASERRSMFDRIPAP